MEEWVMWVIFIAVLIGIIIISAIVACCCGEVNCGELENFQTRNINNLASVRLWKFKDGGS